jgi:hypothetical protein
MKTNPSPGTIIRFHGHEVKVIEYSADQSQVALRPWRSGDFVPWGKIQWHSTEKVKREATIVAVFNDVH